MSGIPSVTIPPEARDVDVVCCAGSRCCAKLIRTPKPAVSSPGIISTPVLIGSTADKINNVALSSLKKG